MKVAILCNGGSDKSTDRVELVELLRNEEIAAYVAGIYTGKINNYYSKRTAEFMPVLASRSNTNPFFEIKSILNIRRQIKVYGIDAVIIYGIKNHPAMAIGAKLGGAKKIMCVVNGSGNLFRIGGIKGTILRFMSFPMLMIAYLSSQYVCFQNQDDLDLFKKKHLILNEKKAFLTGGSGVNLTEFHFWSLPKEDRFLFLARITLSKGIKEYIQAARIVKQKYPETQFDIVGPLDNVVENNVDGFLEDACKKGIVAYHGATDDVPSWMGRCRYFVYPSYYPEGVPRCAIQAIASGRPIITCCTPGCKETVKDGVNGFVVPQQDETALAEKMIWMIEHPVEVERMAEESRKYAEEKFDVHKINKMIIDKLV